MKLFLQWKLKVIVVFDGIRLSRKEIAKKRQATYSKTANERWYDEIVNSTIKVIF